MSIPSVIHQCWFGDPPPDDILHYMHTVRVHHWDWTYMLWNKESLPALGLDSDELLGKLGNWASVSNLVRLHALDKFGGIYLDCDVESFKSLEPLRICNACAALQDDEKVGDNSGRICNAIMGAEMGHPWVKWQLEHFSDYDPNDPASGIYLASAAPRTQLTLIPPHLVYPFHWDDPPEKRKPDEDSIAVHWWLGSWRKK